MSNEYSNGEGTPEEEVLRAANEVVHNWFAYYDPATALIKFQALNLDRFRNVIDFLEEDAKAKGRSTNRVPAPLPVIGTVNIFINQLRLDLGRQLPEEGRDQGGRP